jgi:6-phosphogluconolactonase
MRIQYQQQILQLETEQHPQMAIKEQHFTSIETAADKLAGTLASILCDAISARGRALLAVSGGRTPKYVFERLRRYNVDWRRVQVTLTDERWVPVDNPDSNEKLVRSCLLLGPAAAATFISLFGGEESSEKGQSACEERLKTLMMPFDAVYLGMGNDGHFASLFPGDPALHIQNRLCVAVSATEFRLSRISLTASTILNANKIFLLFSGPNKHSMYFKAKQPGSIEEIPLRMLLSQEQTPITVLTAP